MVPPSECGQPSSEVGQSSRRWPSHQQILFQNRRISCEIWTPWCTGGMARHSAARHCTAPRSRRPAAPSPRNFAARGPPATGRASSGEQPRRPHPGLDTTHVQTPPLTTATSPTGGGTVRTAKMILLPLSAFGNMVSMCGACESALAGMGLGTGGRQL